MFRPSSTGDWLTHRLDEDFVGQDPAETRHVAPQTGKLCGHEPHVLVIFIAKPKEGFIQSGKIGRSAWRCRSSPDRHTLRLTA